MKVAEESDSVQTCSVAAGKLSRVSLLNADVVVKPSIVERIVKVPLGVKDTGFGAVPRTLMTMATTTTITGSEGMVLGRSGTVGHPR